MKEYKTIQEYADLTQKPIGEVFKLVYSGALEYKRENGAIHILYTETEETAQKNTSSEIDTLRQEIERLNNLIVEKDRQISDFANKFAEIAIQSQQIASQAQILQAHSIKKPNIIQRLFGKRKAD